MRKKLKSSSRLPVGTYVEARLRPRDRVFVNRNLRLANVGAIGFDLDHTLAHYRGPAVEELAFLLARDRLVERFGYPQELKGIGYDRSFVIRGLVIDKRRGNILKMDYHNYVARAYHGMRLLRPEERKRQYRSGRVRMSSDSYVTVDTLFHLPEVYLFVVLVNLVEKREKRKLRTFAKVYQDVRESIDSVHGDGSLKREILGNLPRYIQRDPRLADTLDELRRVGKKLFLLTNSEYYYSDALLSHLLGEGPDGPRDWRRYFDVSVVDARKPGFFTDFKRAARPWDGEGEPPPTPVFHGGNARFLEEQLGFRGDELLYFGDHTYGDILRSKKSLGWRTAMVVEELADELEVLETARDQLEELSQYKSLRGVLEVDLSALEMEQRRLQMNMAAGNGSAQVVDQWRRRLATLESEVEEMERELAHVQSLTAELGDEINRRYNPFWGPIFREGQETSRFAHQVKDFACIYMTQVSNLRHYSPNHYFRSFAERLPHEIPG